MATTTIILKGLIGTYDSSTSSVTNEAFTSDFDVPVKLAHGYETDGVIFVASSTVVDDGVGGGAFTEGVDYTMDNHGGYITVLSAGGMADATAYEIDYEYVKPTLSYKINVVANAASTLHAVRTVVQGKQGVAVIVYEP